MMALVEGTVDLADYLDREMRLRGWTHREAAERSGLSKAAITSILNNPDRMPELRTLRGIAEGFSIPIARLLELCGLSLDGLNASKLTPDEEALINRLNADQRAALLEIVRQMIRDE
jgi:transcriptional regulator with XRE-family HTH domain